tara:strand:+ start:2388 stop:3131 length:744 start_codon:yes stop_codon:yes gene_type:complete
MKNLPRLGVNIDHVATLRNARGENYPSPLRAALLCKEYGADGITAHLREDRRHINDSDILEIKKKVDLPLNFEMAPTNEMLQIAIKTKPNACCIVPEKREEVTTEGGINVIKNHNSLVNLIKELKNNGIRVSLFIDPSNDQIIAAKDIGADIIEIHTGEFCKNVHLGLNFESSFAKIKEASFFANHMGLEVHLGHGITFESIEKLSEINEIKEFNIGHFIVSESVFLGLKDTINEFKRLIEKGRVSR